MMAATCELPREAVQELRETGFTVMADPVVLDEFARIVAAYDSAVFAAQPNDVSIGRSTTRVDDFVNRGPDFDQFYVYPPLLAACCYEGQISACGAAGSIVIYIGSVWHGHGANLTSQRRRSIQGAYIRREVPGW
jgi:hypothetical protein